MSVTFYSARIEFLSRQDGMQKIRTSDTYTQNLTQCDRMAKVRTIDPAVSESDYLENCQLYVRAWKNDEIEYLTTAIQVADQRMSELGARVNLPETIFFIATTGWEEGGARGYTREDAIYLNQRRLSKTLVFHELFHVISRYNISKRDQFFQTVGFNKCNDIAETSRLTKD